jgi:hypothetical protein
MSGYKEISPFESEIELLLWWLAWRRVGEEVEVHRVQAGVERIRRL